MIKDIRKLTEASPGKPGSDFIPLSEELLGFIPIPLSGTRNKKMKLRFGGKWTNCCKAVSLRAILTR